jgi:hypothetical protein
LGLTVRLLRAITIKGHNLPLKKGQIIPFYNIPELVVTMNSMMATMQIEPDAVQHAALTAYCLRYAEAGTWLAREVFRSHITDQVRLHRLYYEALRSRFDLPSQSSVL